jgi:tetratricopeptide (TPR) repeat protein
MFDIKEFYKARKKLFENQNKIHTLSDLQDYLSDLDMVCANERSIEIADFLSSIIEVVKPLNDNLILFELYWQYFLQTYYYVEKLNATEKILELMRKIAGQTKNMKQKLRLFQAESLIHQLKNNTERAIELIQEALNLVKKEKEVYPEIYYSTLYSYAQLRFQQNRDFPNIIENMEECLEYYSYGFRMRGLISAIHNVIKFYLYSSDEKKIEELVQWIFIEKQLQNNMLDNHYIMLYWTLGTMFTVRNKLDQAIKYLFNAHLKITTEELQEEMMYEYTDILKFLSRCYAYRGKFQESYDLLVELVSFMEKKYVKDNYFSKGKKTIFSGVYYTLLFIFVQLDLDIEKIKDERLRRVYDYINSLFEQSKISNDFMLNVFSDDSDIKNLLDSKKDESEDEMSLVLHQLLLTHVPYQSEEQSVKAIQKMRDYTFDPLYADILLGKILISMGNYKKFREIVNKIIRETIDTKAPILKLWRDFYVLLKNYLDEPDNKDVVEELVRLEEYCRRNNFIKMEEEIKMYHRLISSTRTIDQFTDKIKQTAFMDMYDKESRRMAIEYLERKKS